MSARLVVASFGGSCVALSFPPATCWPAVFVGVALILRAARGRRYGARLLLGWTAGVAGYAVAFGWLWGTLARFTGASSTVAAAGVTLFVGYHALQLALFSLFAADRDGEGLLSHCVTVAALWVLIEWSFPKVIPWTLADGLAGALLLRQAADLAGPHGLSFAIVAAAAALARVLPAPIARRDCQHPLATVIAVVAALAVYGAVRVVQFDAGTSDDRLHVTLVQGGLGLHADPQRQNDLAWKIYEPLTLAATAQPMAVAGRVVGRLVVWPEGTLRAHLRTDAGQLRRVRRFLSLLHQPLLVGALDLPAMGAGELNAAFLLTGAGSRAPSMETYHKAKLVPFAEYVPGVDLIGSLGEWRTTGDFIRGETRRPLDLTSGVRLAPAICFEVLHPGGFNHMVRAGARLLVNLSDDGWFAGTAEVQQHLGMSVMRAVETRRWLARASDSGVSAFIDPVGRVVAKLDAGAIGAIRMDVGLERAMSLYVKLGNWIVPVCAALLAGRLLGKRRRRSIETCPRFAV